MKKYCLLICFLFAFAVINKAQYSVLLNFNSANGANPGGTLIISGNMLYGLTTLGGANNYGCIFKIDTNGNEYRDLFDFNGANGNGPFGSLILSGKELYGMTPYGGTYNYGNIFCIDTVGNSYRILLTFNGANGASPTGSLILSGERLYGLTTSGGLYDSGVVFSLDTNGAGYGDLFDFHGINGGYPGGSLTLSGSILYGMSNKGGINGDGFIFSIDTEGNGYKRLLDFNDTNGANPLYNSVTIRGNKLYGMTSYGGKYLGIGAMFSLDTNGSGYKDLFDFDETNGQWPFGSLSILGNTLYGMTSYGGGYYNGSMFAIDTNGADFTRLYDFSVPDGSNPANGLVVSGNMLYGMTSSGGTNGDGVIFSFKDTIIINSIDEVSKAVSGEIKVFPNPNNGTFILSLSNINEKCNVEIFNILGQEVKREELKAKSNEIDLSSQPDGIYLYRVLKEDGSLVGEGKVVIEK